MKKRILWGIAIFVILGTISFVSIKTFEAGGVEFCPQTFEERTFTYHKGLFRTINMDRGVPRPISSTSIANQLKPITTAKRWDLISASWLRTSKVGDAQVLVQYLDTSNAFSSKGLADWTNDHPELAAELWPRLQTLAIHHLYFAVPDVIGYAQRKSISVDEFKRLADQRTLVAAIEQLRHLLANETPTHSSSDRKIYLLRLTQWLDARNDIATLLDQTQASEMNSLRGSASLLLRGFQDARLSNEETPSLSLPAPSNAATPKTISPNPSAKP